MTEEEKIARDKEAVKALIGAKANMEAALSRIKTLENALSHVSGNVENIKAAFGDGMVIRFYNFSTSQYETVKANEYCGRITEFIKTKL